MAQTPENRAFCALGEGFLLAYCPVCITKMHTKLHVNTFSRIINILHCLSEFKKQAENLWFPPQILKITVQFADFV